MKSLRFFLLTAGLLFGVCAGAADKLAVAEPVGKGGVQASDIETFWGMLESSIRSEEYKLISRGALKQMLTEIGLTASSDLVNLNSAQKAKLGQLEGVKYILVSEIGRFGSRLNCTMKILDASTGEIDQMRTAKLRVKDLNELADKLEATLQKMLSDDKQSPAAALLKPVVKVSGAPAYLAEDFNALLESSLMNAGMELQNLTSVNRILAQNDLGKLDELEPKMYVKVGQLLEVKKIVQATLTRFEIIRIPYNVEETGAQGFRWIGTIEGHVRAISAQTGRTVASVPFEEKFNFRNLSRDVTRDWTPDDYGKYLIRTVIPKRILPALQKNPAFMK